MDAWSGNNNDYRFIPGILVSNRKIALGGTALYDLIVAALHEYGISRLPEMIGHDYLASAQKVQAIKGGTGVPFQSQD